MRTVFKIYLPLLKSESLRSLSHFKFTADIGLFSILKAYSLMEDELATGYSWEYYDLFCLIKTARRLIGVDKLTVSRVDREIVTLNW